MLELSDCLKTVVLTVNRELGNLLGQWGYPVRYRQHDPTGAKMVVDGWRAVDARCVRECAPPTEEMLFLPTTTHLWDCPYLFPYTAIVSVWVDRGIVQLGTVFRSFRRSISPGEFSTVGGIEAVSSAFVFMAVAGLVTAAVKGKVLRDKTLPFKLAHLEDTTLRLLPRTRSPNFFYDEIRVDFSFNKITDEWIWRVVGALYTTTLHSLDGREDEIVTLRYPIKENPINEGERLIQAIGKAYWLGQL
ncbi:MAG: hypothetical protein RQ862_03455 [Candidatus Caldarchaeales archaeon]|jgi:hypothetical protein|nr:hypothetical protein [Candidatus Caldarchaeales archaeon]